MGGRCKKWSNGGGFLPNYAAWISISTTIRWADRRRENNKFIICIPRAVVNMVLRARLPSGPPNMPLQLCRVNSSLRGSVRLAPAASTEITDTFCYSDHWSDSDIHNQQFLVYLNKAPNLLSTTCQMGMEFTCMHVLNSWMLSTKSLLYSITLMLEDLDMLHTKKTWWIFDNFTLNKYIDVSRELFNAFSLFLPSPFWRSIEWKNFIVSPTPTW